MRSVVVLVPRRPARVGAVDSQLMAAAHLARGFGALPGTEGHLVTEEGLADPGDVIARAVRPGGAAGRSRLAALPLGARLALGDAQAVRRSVRLRGARFLDDVQAGVGGSVDLVVQYHHRFQDAGRRLARRHDCPWVVRVEALEVAEQRDWGMGRPVLGPMVGALGERRVLARADLLAPVSQPLAEQLGAAGLASRPTVVAPNGVDLDLFAPDGPAAERPDALRGRFLLGWVGGFRPYHGLDQVEGLLERLADTVPDATLCLVGEGPMRPTLEGLAAQRPDQLHLVPAQPQRLLPPWLRTFDACVHLARPEGAEHYSSLKLLEYQACGRPLVAPRNRATNGLVDGTDALFYPAGDRDALVAAISRLRSDDALRERLGRAARDAAVTRGSWTRTAAVIDDGSGAGGAT